jgi:hypothetical protein
MRVEPAPRLEVNQSASGQEENLNQAQQRAPNLTACNVVMKEFVDCLGKWDHKLMIMIIRDCILWELHRPQQHSQSE